MQWAKVGKNINDAIIHDCSFFKDKSEHCYRAYCPCCEEQLQIVHKKDHTPHFFRHNKTTPETKECEKRVYQMYNSYSNNSHHLITSIVPLYLVNEGSKFHLEVKFNPIPVDLIPYDDSYLTIGLNKFLLKNINEWLFKREIQEVPDNPSNIYLKYSPDCTSEVKKINGSVVDSLECGWGFFNTDSGKKVHSGGYLYINQNYFLLTKTENIPSTLKSDIKYKFQNSEYKIYFINFSNIQDISTIQSFLQQEKISLKKAEKRSLILWPPCIHQSGIIKPCMPTTNIYIWADNPQGSKLHSKLGCIDGVCLQKNIIQHCHISDSSTINIELESTIEDFDFSPLKNTDLSTPQDLSMVFKNNHEKIVDTYYKNIKTVHFNFDAIVEVHSKNGRCEHRHIQKGVLDNNPDNTHLEVYSKHRFVCNIKVNNELDQELSMERTELLSYPRVKVPANLDNLLIKHFSNYPIKARMIKQSCFDGTISKHLLYRIMLSE